MQLCLESIRAKLGIYTAKNFFEYIRSRYLSFKGLGKCPAQNRVLEDLVTEVSIKLRENPNELWASQKFQLAFRVTKPEHLRILSVNGASQREAERAVTAGRVMSLLPYNTLMGETTLKKFLPSMPEKFSGKWKHSIDPYGIFRDIDRIEAVDCSGNRIYLATRKFPYAVLVNITEACHFGCDGCYKGSMVRTALSALAGVCLEYAEIKKQLTTEEKRAVEQARLLTLWLNEHPEVDSVIISGGEPTLFSNQSLERIVSQFKSAEHVKVVRMCTSSLFQGMWYRIDDDFVKILSDFKKETGKQFYVNAHVTDEFQLSAPEAKIAVDRLQNAGISVHLQMPIQEGINFRREDLEWTAEKLRRISKQAYLLGVIPYKMIVDMHSPSHPDLTVPIETFTRAVRCLDEHLINSDMERWQACNLLHEQGNLYLYPHPHFTAIKEIDKKRKRVIYFIPKKDSIHTYEEPLIIGHNDNPNSLSPIADSEICKRVDGVREAYHSLRDEIRELETRSLTFEQKAREIEKFERDFYKKSGITFPENNPLILKNEQPK
ncbi:4Fe-4S cluster-binding domain-containing protein [Candidatus Pacearchaeota archaeon]|nr:4Fe-4S cluster-binding domain-containing protein [Candidatus Pacearchaeota archaeon]